MVATDVEIRGINQAHSPEGQCANWSQSRSWWKIVVADLTQQCRWCQWAICYSSSLYTARSTAFKSPCPQHLTVHKHQSGNLSMLPIPFSLIDCIGVEHSASFSLLDYLQLWSFVSVESWTPAALAPDQCLNQRLNNQRWLHRYGSLGNDKIFCKVLILSNICIY